MTRILNVALLLFAAQITGAELGLDAVQQRVDQLQPRTEEKRIDEIGWAKDIREALRLAKQHNRPVFLFTHDGRMNIGRC